MLAQTYRPIFVPEVFEDVAREGVIDGVSSSYLLLKSRSRSNMDTRKPFGRSAGVCCGWCSKVCDGRPMY